MPIGYDDVKAIFKDMDANKRFEIFRCIPSLHGADRATSLKLNTLKFRVDKGDEYIILNGTEYLIGVENSLLAAFIDGRRHPVQVKHLDMCRGVPLQLSLGIKFKVRWLNVNVTLGGFKSKLEALSPIIDESSFPLQKLTLHGAKKEDLHEKVAMEAEELVLCCRAKIRWIDAFTSLPNKRVTTLAYEPKILESFITLIIRWDENARAVGTCFTFEMRKETGQEIMEVVGEWFERSAEVKDGWIILPMKNGSSQVEMGIEPSAYINDIRKPISGEWIQLTIKVAPIGTSN